MTARADANKIWADALQHLRSMLTQDIFQLWFSPIKPAGIHDGAITLEVPNDFTELWLKQNYLTLIRQVLATASGEQLDVRFRASNAPVHEAMAPRPPAPIFSPASSSRSP